jgi:flagellar hook-associated protein 2
MSLGGLSGLASGVDTGSIVDQLISLERQQNARLGLRKSAAQARQTALKDIATKLNALRTAAQDLSSAGTWATSQTVESSAPTKVAATLTAGAGIGGTTIQVDRLASSAQRGYAWVPDTTERTLTVANTKDPSSTVTIQVKANATAAEVAAALNASVASPVGAAVVKDADGNERLVLNARKTGQDSAFTVTTAGLAAGQMTEETAYQKLGTVLDAAYRLNGGTTVLPSQSNTLADVVPGLKLQLKGVTAGFETITVGSPATDTDAMKTKIKAFVDAYNAVVTTTRAKVTEKSIADARTTTDAAKGSLFGDSGLLGMLSALRVRMGDPVSGATGLDQLADIGVAVPKATGSTSQDAKEGKLAIDDAKLSAALAADPAKVRDLFEGFSAGLESFIKTQTGASGVLDMRDKSAAEEIKRITTQADLAETRLQAKEKRLKAQFAAMETALLNSQSQSAWLSGQLSSLTRS